MVATLEPFLRAVDELLAYAEGRRLARLQPPRESLVRLRLTIELQFGRRKVEGAKRLQAG